MSETCSNCNAVFKGEEIEAPMEYRGNKLCDICYDDVSFPCALCCEAMTLDNIGLFMIVDDDIDWGVGPGFYKIVSTPFFVDDMFSQTIFPHAVEKVKELAEEHADWDAGGYICENCGGSLQ